MLADQLRKIVERTPGALGAILMGFDGIAVLQHQAEDADGSIDLESAGMEFSFRFLELIRAAHSLEMGEVHDITLKAELHTVICRVLSDDYFVAIILRESTHLGKGRFLLRTAAPALLAEL